MTTLTVLVAEMALPVVPRPLAGCSALKATL
jgi:hypothetical protein